MTERGEKKSVFFFFFDELVRKRVSRTFVCSNMRPINQTLGTSIPTLHKHSLPEAFPKHDFYVRSQKKKKYTYI